MKPGGKVKGVFAGRALFFVFVAFFDLFSSLGALRALKRDLLRKGKKGKGKKRRAADFDESKSAARTRSTNVKRVEPASISR